MSGRAPVSTYRVQFGPGMGFREAAALTDYLVALGATALYASPLLDPRPGSTHGYDVCDPGRLNPALGDEAAFEEFRSRLAAHGMGLILDFVPNHMGIHSRVNRWWRDVLEHGPSSPSARFFDIEWQPVKPELENKLLVPILGNQYGTVLAERQLRVHYEGGEFTLLYWDTDLPLNPRSVRHLLRHRMDLLEAEAGKEDPDVRELLSILFTLEHMPRYMNTDPVAAAERQREKGVVRARLADLTARSPVVLRHVQAAVDAFNTPEGDNREYRLLHQLLEDQAYRLAYWRTAMHEINYRRFFDINELAAIRMEDPVVFDACHGLVRELASQGVVTGLRLDHVDGLYDPAAYFERLHETVARPHGNRIYLVVEKILNGGETLPEDWQVDGTTGYDFLNRLNGVLMDPSGCARLRRIYARFTGEKEPFATHVYHAKKLIIAASMASELNVLAHELNRISEADWQYRDFTLDSLQEALREIVACFPVYRTYVSERGSTEFDQWAIDTAVARALRRNRALEPSIFAFIARMLLPRREEIPQEQAFQRALKLAMKFQQYTGPVHAKGVEDTAFYRWGPLLSLNEVGAEPQMFGCSLGEFHQSNSERRAARPLAMTATATHDTKRGEDARTRLNVLSEIPDEFRVWLSQARRANAGAKTILDGAPAPDRADEYFYYQSLLGAWPAGSPVEPGDAFAGRMREYMRKATKEKKVHTSWVQPSEAYDRAVSEFVTRTLTGKRHERFRQSLADFHTRVARFGMLNSLSQMVLKLCSPGVPDIYQGRELWDFSLVDPDNRTPVDFELRKNMLGDLEPLLAGQGSDAGHLDLLDNWTDARIKMLITAAGLRLRRRWRDVFLEGSYEPLDVDGARRDHVIAFARRLGGRSVVAIAPRFYVTMSPEAGWPTGEPVWLDTAVAIPDCTWNDVLTGAAPTGREGRLRLAEALRLWPVAILTAETTS